MNILTYFASEATQAAADSADDGGGIFGRIFGALGIDWRMMILQLIAFALLVFILAKFVYPPIQRMLDKRDKLIEDSLKAARDAQKKSDATEAEIAKALKEARDEANDIVQSARDQSAQMLIDAEAEAQKRADKTVESARQQLERDVNAARKMLRDETASLVAFATETVVEQKVDQKADAKLIDAALTKASKTREAK